MKAQCQTEPWANESSVLRQWYVFNENNPDRPFEYAYDYSNLPSLNYNNPLVRNMFLDFIEFWMELGVDALRCDIATFVPPSFWRAARRRVIGRQPGGAMLAEIIPLSVGFFDEEFDLAYDSFLYWNYKDIFAKTRGLDSFNGPLVAAEHFIQDGYIKHVREKVDPANVLRMRYLDTQDEDRFLLQAGRNKDAQRSAIGSLLTLPGTPMTYYGNEQGAEETAGETDAGSEETTSAPTSVVTARFFYSAPFSALEGAGQRPAVPFSITVPCDLSVNLLLKLVRSGYEAAPGIQVAQMQFASADSSTTLSTLIPWQADDYCGERANQLDLGLVKLTLAKRGELTSGSIELGQGNSNNLLDLVPAPEGQPTEQDRNGDGIVDSAQTFSALPDLLTPGAPPGEDPSAPQPDGIPDLFQ